LTVIFTNSDFWIETHRVQLANIPATSVGTLVFNLDKGGRFLGYSISPDEPSTAFIAVLGAIGCRDGSGGNLQYGEAINSMTAIVENLSAGLETINVWVVVYLRK